MAYGFNEDRSKAPVYTKAEIDAMDLANDQALQQEAVNRQAGDSALDARISNIIAQGQSTEGNTELIDIRTGYDGVVYPTAGDTVRSQGHRFWSYVDYLSQAVYYPDLDNEFDNYTDYQGYYIGPTGLIAGSQPNSFKVRTIPVTAYEPILLYGIDVKLSAANTLVGFSESSFSDGLRVGVIILGSSTPTTYEQVFIPESNGYLYIAYRDGYGIMKAYSQSQLKDVISQIDKSEEIDGVIDYLDFEFYPDDPLDGTLYTGYYINNGPNLMPISNTNFKVRQYPVTAGVHYKFYGNSIQLGANYPLAAFSTSNLADGANFPVEPIINDGTQGTVQDYNVDYTPNQNGYVYVAIRYNELLFATSSFISSLIYDLTNSSLESINMQAFGDSITDETWRTDSTTWATLISDVIKNRTINVTNSGVGGSHMGHGKSSTGRYSDLEYNYVYDLVTNENILNTDSDIIVIFAGTNDYNSTQLGEWGDDSYSTFYGSVKLVAEYLSENFGGLVIFVTPPARYNSTDQGRQTNAYGEPLNSYGKTLREYCDAITETACFYGYPVVDLNKELGWNRNNVSRFTSDGLHPTPLGAQKIALLIASEIRKHLYF